MDDLQTKYNIALEALTLMRERAEQAEDARESAERDITEHCKENQRLRDELRFFKSAHFGRFELRQDEDTGRIYWWGAEDGWKDATEVGKDGTLTLSVEHFKVGTILRFSEPTDQIV